MSTEFKLQPRKKYVWQTLHDLLSSIQSISGGSGSKIINSAEGAWLATTPMVNGVVTFAYDFSQDPNPTMPNGLCEDWILCEYATVDANTVRITKYIGHYYSFNMTLVNGNTEIEFTFGRQEGGQSLSHPGTNLMLLKNSQLEITGGWAGYQQLLGFKTIGSTDVNIPYKYSRSGSTIYLLAR